MPCLRSLGGSALGVALIVCYGAAAHAQSPPPPRYPALSSELSNAAPGPRPRAVAQHERPEPERPEPLDLETAEPTPLRPRARGTHFLLEGHLGVARSPVGPSAALVFGAGGKMPGSPFRFYFLTELGASQRGGPDSLGGGQTLWVGPGVRAYLPLAMHLRVFADFLGGAAYLRDELIARRDGLYLSRWRPQLSLGAGLQLRLMRELSVGSRAAYLVVGGEGPQSPLAERSGWTFTGSATWHF